MSARPLPSKIRAAVLERDEHRCQRCGQRIGNLYSIQHRKARGMGGTSCDPHTMSNLVTLCGSATSPQGCHHEVESRRAQSYEDGWLVRHGHDPAAVPVMRFGRSRWYLSDTWTAA